MDKERTTQLYDRVMEMINATPGVTDSEIIVAMCMVLGRVPIVQGESQKERDEITAHIRETLEFNFAEWAREYGLGAATPH